MREGHNYIYNFIRKCIALCLILLMTYISAFSNSYSLLADSQSDYDNANRDLEQLKSSQSELNKEFADINSQVVSSGEKLADIELKITEKQAEIDAKNLEIEELNRDIDSQYESMKLRIKYMYEHSNSDTIELLLSAESLSDLLLKSSYINNISTYDHNMMQKLSDELSTLVATKNQLEEDMNSLISLKNDAQSEANDLNSLLDSVQTRIDVNSSSITETEALCLKYEKQIEEERAAKERAALAERLKKAATDNSNLTSNVTNAGTVVAYSDSDVALMAAIIECEAENQPYEGKKAVASVIINRVIDSRFPNSISGVIYAPYQFSPASSGRLAIVLARGSCSECYQAAIDVLSGGINIDALYFHAYSPSEDIGGTVIGDHVFYKDL